MADLAVIQSLAVTIEARTAAFEKALARIDKQNRTTFTKIESDGKRHLAALETALSKTSARMNGWLKSTAIGLTSALSVQGTKELIDSATRITNALKVAGLSGADLTRVYDRLYASAQKNGAPLEALATLYGRAAQQQKELGVGTEDFLRFTDNVSLALRVAGTDASQASGALLQLGQALGSGTVHAEEFNSILEGVPTIAQAAAAGIEEANGSVAALKQLVVGGKLSSRAFFDGFAAGAVILEEKVKGATMTTSQGFTVLANSLIRAAGRFDTSTEASKRFGAALSTLAEYVDHMNFDGMLHGLDAAAAKLNALVSLTENWGEALGRATGAEKLGKWLATTKLGDAIGVTSPALLRDRMSGDVPQADALIQAWAKRHYAEISTTSKSDRLPAASKIEPITLADYPVTGAKKSGTWSKAVKKTADDRFSSIIQDTKDRTTALAEEQAALGRSFLAQQKRKTSLDLEQEALRQVREAARLKGDKDWQNAQLSSAQVQAIDDVSTAYANQADQLRKATEMQDLQRDVLKGAFDDLRSSIEAGNFSWRDLGNIAIHALDKIIDKIENDLIDAIMQANSAASGGGGIFGSLLSILGIVGGGASGGGTTAFASEIVNGTRVGLFHNGRFPGNSGSSRLADPAMFIGAPRYHDGRIPGLAPDEEAAILRKNELVFRDMGHARSILGDGQESAAAGPSAVTFKVDVSGAHGDREIEERATAAVNRALEAYDRLMPNRIGKHLQKAKTFGTVG